MTRKIRQISTPLAAAALAVAAMLASAASRPSMVTEKESVTGNPKNHNQVLL